MNSIKMAKNEEIDELADFYKMFADKTRLAILLALEQKELCVYELSDLLDRSQSAISHQLRLLKQTRLVKNRQSGKHVYYSLDDDHIELIVKAGFDHIRE